MEPSPSPSSGSTPPATEETPCRPNINVRFQPMYALGRWCLNHDRPISACEELHRLRAVLESIANGNWFLTFKVPEPTWEDLNTVHRSIADIAEALRAAARSALKGDGQ